MSEDCKKSELRYLGLNLVRDGRDEEALKEALLLEAAKKSAIEVPEALLEEEYSMQLLAYKHNVRYESMATGSMCFPDPEKEAEMSKLLQVEAYQTVKTDLLVKAIIAAEGLTVSFEELEAEAIASAKRLEIPLDMARSFYGEDYGLLKNDLLRKKVVELIYDSAVIN